MNFFLSDSFSNIILMLLRLYRFSATRNLALIRDNPFRLLFSSKFSIRLIRSSIFQCFMVKSPKCVTCILVCFRLDRLALTSW